MEKIWANSGDPHLVEPDNLFSDRLPASPVRPRLRRLPSEYLYENVYASFQHDRSAVAAATAVGWNNVCRGADYLHTEGTFGHTPHVPPAPAA